MNSTVIRNAVESMFNTQIHIPSREREMVYMRSIYYKLCKDFTFESLTKIGKAVNKDHATVIHGLKKRKKKLPTYPIVIRKKYQKVSRNKVMFFYCLISRYFDERLVSNPEISFREGHGGKGKFDSISRISAGERVET